MENIVVDDIFRNTDATEVNMSFNGNDRDSLEAYATKVAKAFIKYLTSLGFVKKEETNKWTYGLINPKDNVYARVTCFFRTIEINFWIEKEYGRSEQYLDKLKFLKYTNYTFKWCLDYKDKNNLSFSSNGKARDLYQDEKSKEHMTSEELIIKRFREKCWHKPEAKMPNFKLSMSDGSSGEPEYNIKDRDGKEILNGQIKFFRYNGYLCKGKVYHNINNMWWAIVNDKFYTNMACFELFDPTEEDLKYKKLSRNVKPASYFDKFKDKYPFEYNVKAFLYNQVEVKTLGQIFTDYCENYLFLDRLKKKIKNMPEEYYYIAREETYRIFCELKLNGEHLEIVYRHKNYIIIMVNNERILEIDSRIVHWNKEKVQECANKYKALFKLMF